MGELLLRIISSCSRLRERNRRISAEGQFTLHSMEAIFNAPKFAADRIDQKIKAARIRDLIRLIFWLRFADRGVGERHLGASQIRGFSKDPGYGTSGSA